MTQSKKPNKEVKINDHKVIAYVNTGSDICLLRSDKYIRLGSPRLNLKEIRFRGIGSDDNVTLGEFSTNVMTDGCMYPILIRVVSDALLSHDLIIGADFLNTVEMTIKVGEIFINTLSCVDESVPEVLQIYVDFEENNEIDVSHVLDRVQK